MGNSTKPISELVEEVARHDLVLPEMQRRYVWRSTQVRDLFDSLYRGYPVGSILVWERPFGEEARNLDVGEAAGARRSGQKLLLLDGQQRLTSLTSIIKDQELLVRGRKKSLDIVFNVLHPDFDEDEILDIDAAADVEDDDDGDDEETDALDFEKKTFVVATRRLMNQPGWVSLRQVFKEDSASLWMSVVEKLNLDLKSEAAKKILGRISKLQGIAKVMIPIVTLPSTMDYRTVTDVFCRVNSAGARLKGSDLALAQITSRWRGSLKLFEEFQKKYTTNGQQLFDLGFLVRALVVFMTGQCKFLSIASITVERYDAAWKETKDALETAFDVVRNWGLNSFTLLSAPSLIITIAYYMKRRPAEMTDLSLLHKWLLVASVCGHYSKGSSESIMDRDLAAIDKGVSLADMFQSFQKQGWNGKITEDEIKGKFHGSAYFGLMYLAMHEAGAKDWYQDSAISLGNVGSVLKVQFHHICPQALLKATQKYDVTEINDISNLAFIGGNTNRRISAEAPEVYLPKISEANRRVQCVPMDASLYPVDRFREFLAARRTLLVEMLNRYLEGIHVA
jgi:hypothetical protein